MNFMSAGDLGDIIYALPVIRASGGGLLYLHAEPWTREAMNEDRVASLRSLLVAQPYIKGVQWLKELPAGEKIDVSLNDFRAFYFNAWRKPNFPMRRSLCDWILMTHAVSLSEQNVQWISVEPSSGSPAVIINRTSHSGPHRYHNPRFPWKRVLEKYQDPAFVGTVTEHSAFCREFGEIARLPTENLLALAQAIAGAKLFIGNQSCPYAIAEGLKRPAILEVYPERPNCLFYRPDVIHGWDENVKLPDL